MSLSKLIPATVPNAFPEPGTATGNQGDHHRKPIPGNMTMTTRFPSRRLFFLFLLSGLIPAAGCEKNDAPLALADLSGDEYVFVERMVILERAKTTALLDRETGDALLDSLAATWGDSSLTRTLAGAPRDPVRAEAVAALLRRVIEAEQESLLTSTGLERLVRPLPDPAPVPSEAPPES